MCLLRLETWLAEKLHWLHLCGFSSVWMRKWVFKWETWLNDLLHWEHLCLLTPLWICTWFLRLLTLENVLAHWSQDFWFAIFCPSIDTSSFWLSLLMTGGKVCIKKIEIPLSTLPFTIKQMFKQKLTCCQYLYIHWSLHWSSTDITNIKITTTIILDPWSTTYWTPPPLLFWGWPLVRNQKQKIGLKSPSPMLWKIGYWSKYLGDTIQLVSTHVEAIYGTNIA